MVSHEQNGLWPRAVAWLVRHSPVSLLCGLALVIAAHWPASRLELDQSIEAMFSDDDPVLQAFVESRQAFGGDEFVFVAYPAPDLYLANDGSTGQRVKHTAIVNPDRLEEIKSFANELGTIPGIVPESTQDLGHMLHPDGESLPSGIRVILRLPTIAEKAMSFAEAVLVSPDRTTVGIALRLGANTKAPEVRQNLIAAIRAKAAAHSPPAMVVGEPVQLADTFRYIEQDGALLGWSAAIVLSIVIGCLFRRLRWVLLPLLVVYASLVFTEATLVLAGLKLSMVSSVLSALITVIGIATTMHVIVHYRALRRVDRQGAGPRTREVDVCQTLTDLGPPVFWTCLTTALGFLALASSSIVPVRSFGIMMAIGTGMVFVSTMLILPGGMLMGRDSLVVKQYPIDRVTVGSLEHLIAHLRRFGWFWLISTCLLMAAAAGGFFRLQVETDFSKNFRDSSPIVQALEFFENEMGGAGSWELLLEAPNGLDEQTVARVRDLSNELRAVKTDGGATITKVVAVTDGLDLIPNVAVRFARTSKLELLKDFQPEFVPSLYSENEGLIRVVLRSNEREASEEKLALIDQAVSLARSYDETARPTGTFLLLALLVDSLLSDQWVSFALATVTIMIAMAVAFRSIRYGLISFIPNALPIALVLGSIGWLEIPVNMGTAMIASVSVGLTVDSSIHYLAAYRRSRARGLSHWEAMSEVHAGTGRALVYSHVALVGGFSVLALSNFVPLIYFGLLVSVAMIVGLFGDLIVLPMLLTLAEGNTAGGRPSETGSDRLV